MNRKIAFLISLLFAVMLIAGAAAEPVIIPVGQVPEDGLTFTKAEALAKATELFADQGYTYSEGKYFRKAGNVLLPDGQAAWITFIERQEEEAAGNLYAVFSADTGETIELYYPDNDVYTWVLLQWRDEKHGSRSYWPVEDQALFDWLFFSGDIELFDPSKTGVSADEAVRIASDWVREDAGIAYDNTSVSYIGHYDDDQIWYDWVISFEEDGSQILIVYVDAETGIIENSYDMAEGEG